jgi:hypothetical protein
MNKTDITSVTNEQFVTYWLSAYQEGIGLIGMVKKYNLDYGQASARASQLRKAGVKLPTMRAPGKNNTSQEVDVGKLNAMVVEQLGEDALNWRTR